jgi:conjugal transfer pilus assembly protein TraV
MIILNGCSSLNSEFDCPMKPGVRCESIDKVNAKVDSGELGSEVTCTSCMQEATMMLDSQGVGYKDSVSGKKMNIWIAPFTDTQGNFHTANHVYTPSSMKSWEA